MQMRGGKVTVVELVQLDPAHAACGDPRTRRNRLSKCQQRAQSEATQLAYVDPHPTPTPTPPLKRTEKGGDGDRERHRDNRETTPRLAILQTALDLSVTSRP